MRVIGRLLGIEHNDGTFKDRDSGQDVPWQNATLHVLDGLTVERVKVKEADFGKIAELSEGELVDVRVIVTPNAGARGPYLTITFAGLAEESEDPQLARIAG